MGTSRCWKVQGGGIRVLPVWEGARQLEDRYICRLFSWTCNYLNLSLPDALLLLSSKDLPLLGLASGYASGIQHLFSQSFVPHYSLTSISQMAGLS